MPVALAGCRIVAPPNLHHAMGRDHLFVDGRHRMTLNVRFLYERNLLIFIILAVDRKISGIFNRPIIRSLNQRVPGSSPGASTKFPYFLLNEIDVV